MCADRDKDKEFVCYRVQHDYSAEEGDGEGIISISVNDVIEVRRSDLADDGTEQNPQGMFSEVT